MVQMGVIKFERSNQCRPVHNIISSEFPKYVHQPWKFMDGKSQIALCLSYEYQRMWIKERDAWQKRIYPENKEVNLDIVKHYVLTFKNYVKRPKPVQKKNFKMKKIGPNWTTREAPAFKLKKNHQSRFTQSKVMRFEGIPSKTSSKRSPDDKAMSYEKAKK